MSYNYQRERAKLFTEHGQEMLVGIRDEAFRLIAESGACTSGKAMRGATGDTWTMLACFDRMVETGDLKELTGPNVWGQHRVFVRGNGRGTNRGTVESCALY